MDGYFGGEFLVICWLVEIVVFGDVLVVVLILMVVYFEVGMFDDVECCCRVVYVLLVKYCIDVGI